MLIPQTRNVGLPMMNLMRFKGFPILQQLHLEGQLLRTSSENWCIINDCTSDPTIVMGVSGKPAELLEIESVLRDQVPVIRGFTRGGTVIVDNGTVFVAFIFNKEAVPDLQPYPQPIMSWSSLLCSKVFQEIGDFHLRENARDHLDFICRMKDYKPRSTFINKTVETTVTQFSLRSFQLEEIETCSETEFHPSTRFLTDEELEAAAVAGQ